jgi:MerR family transcriptional regulator, light-induced transcriptional regulator
MRTLKTREAATLLNVSPNTLRTWERRFGYPKPWRSPGRHRVYTYAEIEALRNALQEGLSVSSAISVACDGLVGDAHALALALSWFRAEQADQAMEASLALRSMERSLEEVLLPALDEVWGRKGAGGAAWAFACRWTYDWVGRAQRLVPPPDGAHVPLIGDASAGELDPATPRIRALELLCGRDGLAVLTLPVRALDGLGEALAALRPTCVVLAGGEVTDDDLARWAYAVRSVAGALPTALYQRGLAERAAAHAHCLPDPPTEAQRQLRELLLSGALNGGSAAARTGGSA